MSAAAHAQQAEPIAPRSVPVAVPADSLRPARLIYEGGLGGKCVIVGTPVYSLPIHALFTVQPALSQLAGVQVTPYSGAPGSPAVVRIRGAASAVPGRDQPLYVVDGLPVFQHTVPDPQSDLRYNPALAEANNNPLLSIPTQDIASVQVLKGALATAQYGLYGQNGVILISTRQAPAGQPFRVSYTGAGTVQQVRRRYELLDAQQYAQLANEDARYDNRNDVYSAAQIAALGRGTDWQREVLRPAALGQQHHVAAEGSTSFGTRYYAAADYLDQAGVVREAYLRRYALRLNASQRLGQHLRVEGRLGLSQTNERRPLASLVPNALTAEPTLPVRTADGQYTAWNRNFPNPAQQAADSYRTPQQRRLQSQLGLYYQVLPGLSAELRTSLERDATELQEYISSRVLVVDGPRIEQTTTYQQWIVAPALRYTRTLGGQHALQAALEGQQWRSRFDNDQRLNSGALGQGRQTSMGVQVNRNALLTAGYTYARRYEVQALVRADQVAPLLGPSRWLYVPGGQLTWHAAEEDFLLGSPVATLDVWAGWGRTGTGAINRRPEFNPPFLIIPLIDRTTQAEAGVHAALWQSRLDVTLEAYQRRTRGATSQYAPMGGGSVVLSSLPYQMYNRGLEATLGSFWQRGRFSGYSRVAASYNRNRFTVDAPFVNASPQRVADGQPLSSFYGLRFQNIDPNTGEFRYADLDGNGQVSYADQQALGTAIAPWQLSVSQQLEYGRLSLQLQVDGLYGYYLYNSSLYYLDQNTGIVNSTTRALNRWTPANRLTDVPRAGTTTARFSDYQLQSGNHLRLTSARFSVEAWRRDARRVQVWLAGYNLLVLTKYRGYDPNVSSAGAAPLRAGLDDNFYPTARTVALGLTATL